MATPRSTDSGTESANKAAMEQITFRFCAECSNMLYPKEDEESHKLQYTCRTCQYTEEAATSCVFRDVMNNAAGETAGVTQDVGSDPTVRISSACACPDHSPSATPPTTHPASKSCESDQDKDLALCIRCGFSLLHCRHCEDPATVAEYKEFCLAHPEFTEAKTANWRDVSHFVHDLGFHAGDRWVTNFATGPFKVLDPTPDDAYDINTYLPGEYPDLDDYDDFATS